MGRLDGGVGRLDGAGGRFEGAVGRLDGAVGRGAMVDGACGRPKWRGACDLTA